MNKNKNPFIENYYYIVRCGSTRAGKLQLDLLQISPRTPPIFSLLLFSSLDANIDEINPSKRKALGVLILSCSRLHKKQHAISITLLPPPSGGGGVLFFTKLFSAICSTLHHNFYRHPPPRPFAPIPSPCTAVPIPLCSSCSRAERAPHLAGGRSHPGDPIGW